MGIHPHQMTPSSWVSLYISLAPVQTIFLPAQHSVGPHSDAGAFGGRRTLVTPIHEYSYTSKSWMRRCHTTDRVKSLRTHCDWPVEVVEHRNDVKRFTARRDRRESDDVAEVDGDAAVVLGRRLAVTLELVPRREC